MCPFFVSRFVFCAKSFFRLFTFLALISHALIGMGNTDRSVERLPSFNKKVNDLLSIGILQSSQFDSIFESKFQLPVNDWNMLSLEGDVGPHENRLGGTWGAFFTPAQRIKFTAERLAQDMHFTFLSGRVRQFIPQYAGGFAYQYLFEDGDKKNSFQTIDVGGYYSEASNKNRGSRLINLNGFNLVDNQYIDGATAYGANIGTRINSWPGFLFNALLNYDDVRYPAFFAGHDAQTKSWLGFTVKATQYLNQDRFLVEGLVSHRAIYDEYLLGVGWNVCKDKWPETRFNLSNLYLVNNNGQPNDNRTQLTMTMSLDGTGEHCSMSHPSEKFNRGSLWDWTGNPAVHMDAVLAKAEELITEPSSVSPSPFVPSPVVVWAGDPFSLSYTFTGTNLSYTYSTTITGSRSLAAPVGLPSWMNASISGNTVTLSGIAPPLDEGTLYHILITATQAGTGAVQTADVALQVVPKLLKLEYVLSSQVPATFTLTQDSVNNGQYKDDSPPSVLDSGESFMSIIGKGSLVLNGSFTYTVIGTPNEYTGMSCKVTYELDKFGFLTQSVVSTNSNRGKVADCQLLKIRTGMTSVSKLVITSP